MKKAKKKFNLLGLLGDTKKTQGKFEMTCDLTRMATCQMVRDEGLALVTVPIHFMIIKRISKILLLNSELVKYFSYFKKCHLQSRLQNCKFKEMVYIISQARNHSIFCFNTISSQQTVHSFKKQSLLG